MQNNTGQLFVRYVIVGLIAIFIAIIVFKTNLLALGNNSLVLGIVIFSINLFIILGYVYAVLKDKNLLYESDSPDLAYYLGFCLTVGALSGTFIIDTAISQNVSAAEKSNLIKNSLLLFGVGLTATLIGLCAKIYLSSLQSIEQTEPEEIYRKFRYELNLFEKEMKSASNDFSLTIKNSVDELNQSVTGAISSFKLLSDSVRNSNDILVDSFSFEKLGKPIVDFSKSVNEFKSVSEELTNNTKSTLQNLNSFTDELSKLQKNVLLTSESLGNIIAKNVELNTSSSNLIATQSKLIESNNSLHINNDVVKTKLEKISDQSSNLYLQFEKLSNSIDNLNKKVVDIGGAFDISSLSSEIQRIKNLMIQTGNELEKFESKLKRVISN